jgi:hypothetical protein
MGFPVLRYHQKQKQDSNQQEKQGASQISQGAHTPKTCCGGSNSNSTTSAFTHKESGSETQKCKQWKLKVI